MAVPTITSITPAIGHTSGAGLVEIIGTGFQTWTIPPAGNEPSGDVWPTVEVLFGGVRGSYVAVVASTRLFVRPPPTPLPGVKPAFGEGAVDVLVRNIDEDGDLIGSETATEIGGYTYQRQQFAVESDLARLVRELLRLFKQQIIPNVSNTSHSDYDLDSEDMLDTVDVGTLPALVLFGPLIQENRMYSLNGMVSRPIGSFEYEVRQPPTTDDLLFTFLGISDQKQEAINLQSSVRIFFKNNPWLYLQRDPADPSLGVVKYDLTLDSAAGVTFSAGPDQKSNLRSFSGSFVVRGFDHEDLAGFAGSDVVGRTRQVTESPSIVAGKKDG